MHTAFDKPNLTLYVQIFQIFSIWVVPFYSAPVHLTTVIILERSGGDGKYYIAAQNDLYQVDQFVKFVAPGAWILVWVWQFVATFFCGLGALIAWPITWAEENWGWGEGLGKGRVEWERKKKGWEGGDGWSRGEKIAG